MANERSKMCSINIKETHRESNSFTLSLPLAWKAKLIHPEINLIPTSQWLVFLVIWLVLSAIYNNVHVQFSDHYIMYVQSIKRNRI